IGTHTAPHGDFATPAKYCCYASGHKDAEHLDQDPLLLNIEDVYDTCQEVWEAGKFHERARENMRLMPNYRVGDSTVMEAILSKNMTEEMEVIL
ncbi:unnamed protein product, partial [Amoebophrya sp. A25]